LSERGKVTEAIQVCYELHEDNKKRELDGLVEAVKTFGLSGGLILTFDQKDELSMGGKKISVKPAWEWMLG
ncbi:MAG: ATP-binding protein, partial [Candidatus Micrarchaeota archaeon]|nr:ATP-binding protein [Candidatus Micrarchaeota archaeon]